jgi:cell division GTPase FtsZ
LQVPGLVNVDFADVRAVMTNAGSSLMGQGRAGGKDRWDTLQLHKPALSLISPYVD